MKKILALLVLVCVALMPAAMAETITWEEVGAPVVEAAKLEGEFVSLSEMGLALWLPTELGYVEPSEEDAAAGRYALFIDAEQSFYVAVDALNVEGLTLDQALENAVANGMNEPEIDNINGLDAVTYDDPANGISCIVLVDTNSNMIVFSFGPTNTEEGQLVAGIIGSSLMPAA